MGLEVANYISQLVSTNPPGSDNAKTMDDHLRVIKNAVYNSLPNINGPVDCTPAQLNGLTGLTANKVLTTNGSSILASSTIDASALLRIGNALTASRLLISDASGYVSNNSVTATEAGYLSGVTSAIQTQLNAKANSSALGALASEDLVSSSFIEPAVAGDVIEVWSRRTSVSYNTSPTKYIELVARRSGTYTMKWRVSGTDIYFSLRKNGSIILSKTPGDSGTPFETDVAVVEDDLIQLYLNSGASSYSNGDLRLAFCSSNPLVSGIQSAYFSYPA